jgi:ABC-type nitrate/sulfonate/bicarbonate transport system substrate-binding protein
VKLVEPIKTIAWAPYYAARTLGYYDQQNVKIDTIQLPGTASADQAVMSGSADASLSLTFQIAPLYDKGIPVQAIVGLLNQTLELCASKKLVQASSLPANATLQQKLAIFKGKTMGAPAPGSSGDLTVRWMLQSYGGLTPGQDVTIVNINSTSALAASLQQDRIDGFLIGPPGCEEAVGNGSGVLHVHPTEVPEFAGGLGGVIFMTKEWAANHKEATRRMATATAMASNYFIQHPEESIKLMQKEFEPVAPNLVESFMKETVLPQAIKDGKMSSSGWEQVNKVLVASGAIKAPIDTKEGGVWTNEYIGDARVP